VITIYQNLSGNSSVRKVINWCEQNGIGYRVRRIDREDEKLTPSELKFIVIQSGGLDCVISSHSHEAQVYLKQAEVQEWPLSRLFEHLVENPHILKGCILTDGQRVLTGYHADDIRLFLKRSWRDVEMALLEERL
jgi:arsenate reductase-like glutaredoxin family protein